MELLEHLHQDRGYAIVAVTHDLNLTVPLSDKVLALKEGEVAFIGEPQQLLEETRSRRSFRAPFTSSPSPMAASVWSCRRVARIGAAAHEASAVDHGDWGPCSSSSVHRSSAWSTSA